ncbi:dihydroorotate dehydrogenase electron transfer subunit [bacterium]|nr:dihydroorotate dehydrogenase electron transfer subunit [bacterium]NIN92829.1 dihydroorotate dehydrogenase electron transfer subunit [bacterium]NIO18784.1 dihydroorotate dehydrogenase electron transfer subunit [bacterium]NIO73865.1 dihydroorotate dehydrogenase electron transfer subunit [bacterium]
MVQIDAKILVNEGIGPQRHKMALYAPQIGRQAKPGQFIHVRVSNNFPPLLRRPFSIHRVEGQKIEILYKVVGKGTEILSEKKRGEYLDILGPLGKGYRLPSATSKISDIILVAGGTGVASLLFLAEAISVANAELSILVLIGAKNREELLCEEDFRRLGCRVEVATENGSRGYKGLASDLLENYLPLSEDRPKPAVFACGPSEMLKRIGKISRKHRFPCQVSLEERLACGVGACLGCVVKAKGSSYTYKRVCKDGPVFDAGELIW